MNDTVAVLSIVQIVVVGTPILLAAVGETLTQRSGVMNLGIEGMMLCGAVFAFWATNETGSVWIGTLTGAIAGAVLALVHAVLAISLRTSQIVSGLALVLVGTGLSGYIGSLGESPLTGEPVVARFPTLFPTAAQDLPLVGPILFGRDLIVYASWILVAVASGYLFRTRAGLALRAVGEDPASADTAGISVARVRYAHTILGGALAGVAGGYLCIQVTGTWQDGITAGIGWIAFALVIFSGWRPWRALVAAYVFGALTSLGYTLQLSGVSIPSELLAMVPFILTIVVLILVSSGRAGARRMRPPKALAVPYTRESR